MLEMHYICKINFTKSHVEIQIEALHIIQTRVK